MSDQSRVEQLLRNALGEDIYEVTPQSRVEELLVQLNELIEGISASVDPEELTPIVTAWLTENIHDGAVVDTSLSVAGTAAESKKTGDEISQLKEDLSYVGEIVAPVRTKITLQNGTIGNHYNANAVRTANRIPCKNGDVVTLYPVRPNAAGYYYLYGYRVYDSAGNTVRNLPDAVAGGNVVNIIDSTAASIDFFWVESDGSEYNALRSTTYGYVPYALTVDGTSLVEKVDALDEHIDEVEEITITTTEILTNATWQQGGISDGEDTDSSIRIKTDFIEIGYVQKFTIDVAANYGYAFDFYDLDKQWLGAHDEWIYDDAIYTMSDYPANTAYIRIVFKRSNNQSIAPADHVNISGEITVVDQQGFDYLNKKIKAVEIETSSEIAHYNNLLSQARFSPPTNPDLPHTANILTLLHFSDVHNNLFAMQRAIELSDIYASKIDDVIHTGDVVLKNYSDGLTNWINSGCAEKVISVIGNHDSEENLTLGTAGQTTVYNGMLAPYIDNWDVVQPTGVDDPTSPYYCACYYYKDYADVKIRLIILDSNWWNSYEKSWLDTVLDDALTNEYSVVFAVHTPKYITGVTQANFCSYTEPVVSESSAMTNIPDDWLDPVDDFIQAGGEVICMLAGHNHRDHFGYLTLYNDVLCISATKASVDRTMDTARITGETNATSYNFVTFNTTDKWIKIVKIGAEVDGEMRGKHVFCYDYANKQIISQW